MPPVIQPGEPVGDGEALQLALALALPHAGHQVLEHLRQLAHLAPTARRMSPPAAQRRAGTRRRVPMTFWPSARLYSTVLPSRSSSSCAIGSFVRIRSAELTRDFRISLP